ncbi:MAG: FAD-binding oxidoreductase [Saprospiraceae bacterium]|nr:FAD-binding oxidoreductase [Saprospiraceae bacterium]MCF8251841.1 FAD-binding oxidoreductase [Saprospiraceae bacterium]MCF8281950.1 FAD-binding oxidoreductase [Bacteroidales bacterium]MCF8313315.1 FAD-binding oxidoreductase [Saprospiraceae bacterium]MCF8441729.1 FAD-binding oxidoreductase [Saprospiraceae bacterium]
MKISVIGSGVIGLTTAIALQEAGHEVHIFTKDLPEATVSAVAAAIWMPFHVEPLELVNRWSRVSYDVFEKMSEDTSSGVSMVNLLTLANSPDVPDWVDAMPAGRFWKAAASDLPAGYQHGFFARVPMIETPIYLPFLQKKFLENGGELTVCEVKSLAKMAMTPDWLINCTGLAAGKLTGDKAVFPIRGQILKVDPMPGLPYLADDDGPNALAYIFPRKDCTVLGGTAQLPLGGLSNDDESPNEEDSVGILRRCQNLLPALATAVVRSVAVGLRPGRTTIRLEREPATNIVHNYGHGGGGYTVSWGCAFEVVEQLRV